MKNAIYEAYRKNRKAIRSSYDESREKSDSQVRIKQGQRLKLWDIGEHVAGVFAQLALPQRKQGKKKLRFIPIALGLYFLIFLVTSLLSLIGGTSASASSQQTTHSQSLHSTSNAATVYPQLGNGEPSNLLDCTVSTTTTTDSGGTATSTNTPGKYIPGGSPVPTCQSGHWACQHGDSSVDDYVPVAVPGNGKQDYVICLGAGNLANPWFYPDQTAYPDLDGCNPNAKYNTDVFVKTKDADVLPLCTDTAGIAGKTWICPVGYKVAFTAYGVDTPDFFDPLQCQPNNSNWIFPCSDISDGLPAVAVIQTDWLSGNHPDALSTTEKAPGAGVGGRFFYTFPEDTFKLDGVTKLMPYTLGIGLVLLTPVIVLVGYQVVLGSITFRYANALQAIPRLVFGIAIIAIAFTMTETFITLSNSITDGMVLLHKDLGFPTTMVNNEPVAYTLANENDPLSYRGMVVPMSRWGCAANEFMKILAAKFVTDVLASIIPIFGNLIHLVATIATFFELIKHMGQFILLILSIMLWAQVIVRIILLNYYILLCPIAFGCWALPGGFGQNVVNQWTKGFFSTLLIQIVQVFVITTLPLVIPALPAIPSDSLGLMKGLLTQLPPILVMWMTVRAPSILGTSTARAVTNAGSVAGGVVSAVGAAAYNIV